MEFLKFDKSRIIGFSASVLLFLLLFLLYSQTMIFDQPERGALDFRFYLRDPSEKSEKIGEGVRKTTINPRARKDIVILGIDETTIRDFSEQGIQWPFPWDIHSRFTDYVRTGNPAAIFFDITFIDHKDGEKRLAETFRKAGNVFVDYPFENVEVDKKYSDQDERIALLNRVRFKADPADTSQQLFEEIVPPTPDIVNSVKGLGFANVVPDPVDNVNRMMPLVAKYNGWYYPNIDLVLAMNYYGIGPENVEIKMGRYIKLKNLPREKMARPNEAGEIIIPIDSHGLMNINYIGGTNSFQSIPYTYFVRDGSMEGNDSLAGKIVMVAAYSVTGIATDIHKSPYGATYGIEHHANALNTILNQDFLFRMPDWSNILVMFILALLLGFLLPRLSIVTSAVVTFVLAILYLVGSYIIFDFYSIINAMLTPVIQIGLTFTVVITYRLMTEQKEKRYIRQTFSKFVSKSVVDDLLKNPHKLKLGGEKKILTVLFSDIRGFTTISEKLTPEALVEHLNVYLQAMTDLVFQYNGTLDKYVGDEIMAFWGAPVEMDDHALNACKCALDQIESLRKMNEKWKAEGKPELNIGIGINTGDMVVGNMGSASRMDYTLMGDNVNLGARLEGTNKVYSTCIIISENTYEHVKDNVVVRELDLIRVKGKNKPVKIYELLDIR
jgi:adenylate cyclase